jgi:hypothetical protein
MLTHGLNFIFILHEHSGLEWLSNLTDLSVHCLFRHEIFQPENRSSYGCSCLHNEWK